MSANGIARYLENHGIHKLPRQNGKNTMFIASYVRNINEHVNREKGEKAHLLSGIVLCPVCGDGMSDWEKAAKLQAEQSAEELYEAAKNEGVINIYTVSSRLFDVTSLAKTMKV